LRLAGGGGDRGGAGLAREAGLGGEPLGAGGAADQRGGGEGAAAGLGQQPGALGLHERAQFGFERVRFAGELPDAGDELARDAHARAGG
jgi:hypothetical protein